MEVKSHSELIVMGASWLRRQGFHVVATEIGAAGCREIPDVVGFRSTCSAIIEVKVSRADFLADSNKPERNGVAKGIGLYRFYLSPNGIISPADLPSGWGLLHVVDDKVKDVIRPLGNMWPGPTDADPWALFQHYVDAEAERSILYSIARRLSSHRKQRK